ncbi:ABC transporter permease [Ilumatobacter nonamiensis]|uniref:ABC transporter permease n=1 Tax=Ilumatobacter nonamiensis TaxID=467093 RepID=UPI00034544D8|nr:ABC transporter permease [Ilumatobacter nonamiensis]
MTTVDDVGSATALPEAAIDDETGAPATRVAPVKRAGDGFLGRFLPPAIMFAIFIGVWYLYSTLAFDQAFQRRNALPYPHEVVVDGFLPLWDPRQGTREIMGYMWPTIKVTLLGLGISIVVGVCIAVVMNMSRYFERAIFPYAVVAQTVPVLAITPLLTQVFGDKLGVRLAVVFLIAVFPIITNTLFGLQSTDRLHHDLFTLNKAGRWTRLWKLELPTALPALMTGIRIASGLAVIGAIVADFFFNQGDKGIGFFIRVRQQKAADRPDMLAGTITASLFGVVMFLIVGAITARAIRDWHDSANHG